MPTQDSEFKIQNSKFKIDDLQAALREQGYIAERGLATALFLSLKLPKPLFLEGEAGVGKTEVAKTLAAVLGTHLIRLQCYEGLDVSTAVYEWNYARQMMRIRVLEAQGHTLEFEEEELFGPEFLIERPLLQAVTYPGPERPVLLIDELDRADEEFEAFLLELLSDFQITVPEVGTLRPAHPPAVVITSNRTREVHDALKRRCLYHWIEHPPFDREVAIVRRRVPDEIAWRVVNAVARLREEELYKSPGVGETIVWARALLALDGDASLEDTLGVALKVHEDLQRVRERGILAGA